MHLVIEVFIYGVFDLFKITFTNTGAAEGTIPAVQGGTTVFFHLVSTIMGILDAFKGQFDASLTLVVIAAGKVAETCSVGLYRPKLGI